MATVPRLPVIQAKPITAVEQGHMAGQGRGSGLIDPTRTGTDPATINRLRTGFMGDFAKTLHDELQAFNPTTGSGVVNLAGLFVPGKGGAKGSYRSSQEDMLAVGDFLGGYTSRGDRLDKPVFTEGPYNPAQTRALNTVLKDVVDRSAGADALQKIERNLRAGASYALPKYRQTMEDFIFDVMAMARNGKYRDASKMVSDVASQFNGPNREAAMHLIKAQSMLFHLSGSQNFSMHTEGPPVRGGATEDKIRAAIEEHLQKYGGQ